MCGGHSVPLRNAARFNYNNVTLRDLVWTRDPKGKYYLARVISGWEYWTSGEGREKNIDIANVLRCDFFDVKLDEVLGVIVSCFGNCGRSIQRIWDSSALTWAGVTVGSE